MKPTSPKETLEERPEQVEAACAGSTAAPHAPTSDAATPSPTYWRSLAELDNDPEFQEFVSREFQTPLQEMPLSSKGRRRFMQLMGASFALAGCRWKEDRLLPETRRPEGLVPGEPVYYATAMDISGVATALWVKSFDGRPIKVEGNPNAPSSLGGTNTYHQGSVLGLYDPDRSQQVVRRDGEQRIGATWGDFMNAARGFVAQARAQGGRGFAVLSESSSSPTLALLRSQLLQAMPQAQWVAYEPSHAPGVEQGAELAFGQRVRTVLAPEKADVLVALDSDLLCPHAEGGVAYSRGVTSRRNPDAGTMSRIYAIESTYSEIGSIADHRVPLRAAQIAAVVSYLDAELSAQAKPPAELGAAQPRPAAKFLEDPEIKKVLDVMVRDLLAHRGRSLIVVGSRQPAEVHALVHRLNVLLGNVGNTLSYLEEADRIGGGPAELAALVAEMEAGRVETLLILGSNPVYTAPADVPFATALGKVKNSLHVGLYEDETARLCRWHAPQAHYLEAWGDARAFDGTVLIAQPLIEPLHGGRSSIELVAQLLGLPVTTGEALLRSTHGAAEEKPWRKAVHDGTLGSSSPTVQPELRPVAPVTLSESSLGSADSIEGLEVVFELDPALHDGRFANNGWLQELPHPISKVAWGNTIMVNPVTAERLGLKDYHMATLTIDGRSVELPVAQVPGQAAGTLTVSLGYGRKAAGKVGGAEAEDIEIIGANTYLLFTAKAGAMATGATVKPLNRRAEDLASTQDMYAIDDIGAHGRDERLPQLVRETTLAEYKAHPDVIKHKVHHPPRLNLWQGPVEYTAQKWGMAIDLNKCTGCNACVVACIAENNTPVVGKREVARGREMNWLRVERYYKGDRKAADVRQMPVLCMHCENAPCEQVCPVGATVHSGEGLNDMVYNRCIGTRYCSNNCPYKVRRFNYRNYNLEFYGTTPYTGTDSPRAKLKSMVFNPDVTVRSRGVMEKCTFCVQRLQRVKIKAKNERRPIKDGEVTTACAQACPTGAYVFGDLNDKASAVAAAHNVPRAYELLQELNNRTRVNYLARIRNPHPELVTQDGHSERH
jgi:molybdopterin-containing oxidoreductase family iron-sulfur binding subunit